MYKSHLLKLQRPHCRFGHQPFFTCANLKNLRTNSHHLVLPTAVNIGTSFYAFSAQCQKRGRVLCVCVCVCMYVHMSRSSACRVYGDVYHDDCMPSQRSAKIKFPIVWPSFIPALEHLPRSGIICGYCGCTQAADRTNSFDQII
jgi:hypothetical protein